MEARRPGRAALFVALFNGVLILYCIAWIAGVSDLRRLSDWRGPLIAFLLAIAITAFTLIQQVQSFE